MAIKQKNIKHKAEELDAVAALATGKVVDSPLTTTQIDNMKQGLGVTDLELKIGKYKVVNQEEREFLIDSSFTENTIVNITEETVIILVEKINVEVILDAPAGIPVTLFNHRLPISVIGEADNSKRRIFSFLNGTLVIGNFDEVVFDI